MGKKKIPIANYLDKIPVRPDRILWSDDAEGLVTLEIENKGAFNKIAQIFFRRPKVSYIHLDENGSFVWKQIDGNKSISEIAPAVDEHFGEAAHPLYERLAKFFEILDSYGFIEWKA